MKKHQDVRTLLHHKLLFSGKYIWSKEGILLSVVEADALKSNLQMLPEVLDQTSSRAVRP